MIGKALAALTFIVSLVCWVIGAWQVYESNTLLGAVLVLAGGALMVGVIAWWRRSRRRLRGCVARDHGVLQSRLTWTARHCSSS
jgi:hypothetical protein